MCAECQSHRSPIYESANRPTITISGIVIGGVGEFRKCLITVLSNMQPTGTFYLARGSPLEKIFRLICFTYLILLRAAVTQYQPQIKRVTATFRSQISH